MRSTGLWIVAACAVVLAACTSYDPAGGPGTQRVASASVPASARSTPGAPSTASVPALKSCDPDFLPTSTPMFNDPSGSRAAQDRLQDYLVKLIDCTPPVNPDGTQATIRLTFYSLTYAPVRRALVAAARRGVSVQVISNSHADRFRAWRRLVRKLGSDIHADSFAVTCWQGCVRPRHPPPPGGPTAWFRAEAVSANSRTVVFSDFSRAGSAPITTWAWDFGDGTHAAGPGPHRTTYRADGIYATSLRVRDAAGVTHTMTGNVTIPDWLEPMYPALHSKVLLASTVGTGRAMRRWVSVYGSGNPTYTQARAGFNNHNVTVGDRELYQEFDQYFSDLLAGSQGALLTEDYDRTISTPGNPQAGSPATIVHFLPRRSGDLQLDILRSITCRYLQGGKMRRTKIRISMYAISRIEIGAEIWRLAYERGCSVDLLYTTMTQRLRGGDGAWIRDDAGAIMKWGVADCLSTPPAEHAGTPLSPGAQPRGTEDPDPVDDPSRLCSGGTLDGRLAGAEGGTWVDRVSPSTGGRLTVTAACPVVTYFDWMLRVWVFTCRESSLFTHGKVMLVDGMVNGKVQKYVMTGSANWTVNGLHHNDDLVTELIDAPAFHDAYLTAHKHQKQALPRARATGAADEP